MDTKGLRLAEAADIKAYGTHLERVINVSGVDGHVVFTPRIAGRFAFEPMRAQTTVAAWAKPITAPGWQRSWLYEQGGTVVGHVELHGGFTESLLHRATLGIALEPALQGAGRGRTMTIHALSWARAQPLLAWIDLKVFETNSRALALYASLGFTTYGRVEDACRIGNASLTDLEMALRLHG